jgi:hypothetical protein
MTESDFVTAKRKTTNAREYRGDVNVSLGDETVTFKHRLLTETEFMRLQQVLDTEALDQDAGGVDPEVGQTDAQQRLLELQQKEELSDAEEAELEELSGEVASQTSKIKDALGDEGFDLLMEMGTDVIKPSDDDVRYVYDLVSEDPNTAKDLMGVSTLPSPITEGAVRENLESELEGMITDQPYPIKLNVGLQAMAETISVLGNGLQRS